MKRKKIFSIILSIIFLSFLTWIIISIGLTIGMQKRERASIAELDTLEVRMKQKYNSSVSIGDLPKECETDKIIDTNIILYIDILNIKNEKYFDKKLIRKEMDSISSLIQEKIRCIDSIYINIRASDTISDKYIYDEIIKYPVIK